MVNARMNENEIIDMCMEAGLDEEDIRMGLAMMGDDRSPERVFGFLQEYKQKMEGEKKSKEEQKIANQKKHKEMLKKQEAYKVNQLKRVQEKIKATQEENRKKEEEFDKETQVGYEDVMIPEHYKLRVMTPEQKSLFIGLPEGAKVKDVYAEVQKTVKSPFVLMMYGEYTEIKNSDEELHHVLRHQTCMLIAEKTTASTVKTQ